MLKAKVKGSETLAMLQRVREMRAQKIDVASFAAGEPDFPTPSIVVEATYKSIKDGNTRYGPTQGQANLREAIAKDYRDRLKAPWVTADHVQITAGSKQGIYLALAALLDKDDQVLVPVPYWVSYPDVIEAALGKPVLVESQRGNGFFPTIDELNAHYNSKVKALIFSSPSNPTGTMISRAHLQKVVDWCVDKKVVLLYDEIYERLVLDGSEHVSALALVDAAKSEYVMSINAFSKTMAMTGWRLGYTVTHKDNVACLSPLQGQMMTSVPGFIQDGAIPGLENADKICGEFLTHYKARLKILSEGLSKIPQMDFVVPSGAFYLFADFRPYMKKYGMSKDKDLMLELLNREKVVLVAGSSFGMPGWVRFSFATSEDEIRKGVERLQRFLS